MLNLLLFADIFVQPFVVRHFENDGGNAFPENPFQFFSRGFRVFDCVVQDSCAKNADIGNAWNRDATTIENFKKGVGAEIRIQLNSYYLFPTSIFFNASYGFDEFNRTVNNEIVKYGREWNLYGGILFGFEILNFNKSPKQR